MISRKLPLLIAAMLSAFATAAGAVALGPLNIRSVPGQPLDATLEIQDVDLSISPILVRVAPPATYLREGVQWPQEAQDLRMTRMSGDPSTVRVRVTGSQKVDASFPLLIEMNAGGVVSVRNYFIQRNPTGFSVLAQNETPSGGTQPAKPSTQGKIIERVERYELPPAAQKPAAAPVQKPAAAPVEKPAPAPVQKPAPAVAQKPVVPTPPLPKAEPRPEPKPAAAPAPQKAAAPAQPAAEPKRQAVRRAPAGSNAPAVVREYVALNGFDPNETFTIQRNMTLWSIAKLYWPGYPGALLEQVSIALTNKNPNAFVNGDPSKIVVGEKLRSPTNAEVFAVDPVKAFREVHGNKVRIPAPTQNLIDAQRHSPAAAAEVAAVQQPMLAKHAAPKAVADAGRDALKRAVAEEERDREAAASA
ncbi:MAG: fimbrial protein FimV, partial [Sutterella sp.]|nr:fimbrial protein FimV [Sutterella sp.]